MALFYKLSQDIRISIYACVFEATVDDVHAIEAFHEERGCYNLHQLRALHESLTNFRYLMQTCRAIRQDISYGPMSFCAEWVRLHQFWRTCDDKWWGLEDDQLRFKNRDVQHPRLTEAHSWTGRNDEDLQFTMSTMVLPSTLVNGIEVRTPLRGGSMASTMTLKSLPASGKAAFKNIVEG